MIDLIVADERRLSREGVRRLMDDHGGLRIVFEASNGQQLLDHIADTSAQLVLIDVSLPGPALPDLVRRIKRRRGPRVLLLSANPGHAGVGIALRSGAAGALARDESVEVLFDAIQRIANGGRFVSRSLTRKSAPPVEGLSDREFEVLRLFGAGRNRRDVAQQLGLSPKTVSTYRARLLKKLGLRNLSELVRFATDRGLVY